VKLIRPILGVLAPYRRQHLDHVNPPISKFSIILQAQLLVLMALPIIKTVQDCIDFSKTVSPYIPQLFALPQLVFESISDPNALKQIYLDTNPLITSFAFSLFLSPIFLIVSEGNRNYSQVDRCWSILPTVYNAHYAIYAHATGLPTERLDTLLAASTIWSV
jgi:steroid 5-alpha reductase family enzyme